MWRSSATPGPASCYLQCSTASATAVAELDTTHEIIKYSDIGRSIHLPVHCCSLFWCLQDSCKVKKKVSKKSIYIAHRRETSNALIILADRGWRISRISGAVTWDFWISDTFGSITTASCSTSVSTQCDRHSLLITFDNIDHWTSFTALASESVKGIFTSKIFYCCLCDNAALKPLRHDQCTQVLLMQWEKHLI